MRILFFLFLLFSEVSFGLIQHWESSLPAQSKFTPSKELEPVVRFWVKIFSHYTSRQGVFHLIDDPTKYKGEIDLTDIYADETLSSLQKEFLAEARVKKMKQYYLKKWKISDASTVRLQMGLKDQMKEAFYHSGKYLSTMERIFKERGLPIELTRLVFVESSFNIFAQSKVGASGLWQIMPATAREKGYIHKDYDFRNDPVYATKLAAQILKSNYRELMSWPLAITAYNHGLTGVKRMMKKAKAVHLEDLIESERVTPSWGFASKNFYACLLAVLRVEKNADELFEGAIYTADPLVLKEFKLPEKTNKEKILGWFNGSWTRLRQLNPHLNWSSLQGKSTIPAGVPFMLPKKKFDVVKNEFYSE